jgi:hypothetical protein
MRTSRAGSETTSDAMARIEVEGNRMARLVDDLLTSPAATKDKLSPRRGSISRHWHAKLSN